MVRPPLLPLRQFTLCISEFILRKKKCARQGAVFLQYSLESVVSSERLLEKR